MSDRFLVVIPEDPSAALPEAASELRDALAKMAGTNEARVKDYGKLQFIDCGTFFQVASCPHCGSAVPLETWKAWMDQDWHGDDGFHLHRHDMTCCSQEATLNQVHYDGPQGFAHWMVSARAAGRGPLTDNELSMLENIGDLKLKAIFQSY